jgi:PII-like signaling protein
LRTPGPAGKHFPAGPGAFLEKTSDWKLSLASLWSLWAEPSARWLAEEFPAMQLSEDGQLLRVFIGESDVWEGTPLYRAIVLKAKELNLAGATVLRGPMGFGANSQLHTTKLLELSTDLPMIVEIVDTAAKVEALLPFLDQDVHEGMITLEAVRVLRYRSNSEKRRT